MTFFNFAKHFAAAGGNAAGQAVAQAIADLAPDLASEADLRDMEEALDGAGIEIQEQRNTLNQERHTYDAILSRYTQMMAAAERLEKQVNETTDPTQKSSLEASLSNLLHQIEEIAPEMEQDKKEVEAQQQLITDLEAAYQAKAKELAGAKGALTQAKADMTRAKLQETRSSERANAARVAVGLATNTTGSGVHVALDSFKRTAEKSRERAAANDMKAQSLQNTTTKVDEDPNIKAAMAAVSGTTSPSSVQDRLAALRQRQAS